MSEQEVAANRRGALPALQLLSVPFAFVLAALFVAAPAEAAQDSPVSRGVQEIQSDVLRIATDGQAAEEAEDGDVDLESAGDDLDMGEDHGRSFVGLRFENVPIPPQATIVNAYIQFRAQNRGDEKGTIWIDAEDSSNSAPFDEEVDHNLTNRARTGHPVEWKQEYRWREDAAGPLQETPSLNALLQSIVDGSGWSAENAVTFFFWGDAERDVCAFDEEDCIGPALHVEYVGRRASPALTSQLFAGVGVTDITPPAGMGTFAYSKKEGKKLTTGFRTRLKARALYLESGGNQVALVQTDLGAVPMLLHDAVADAVKGDGVERTDILISATHTHGGPAGYFSADVYNKLGRSDTVLVGSGFDAATFRFLTSRIARAIRRAVATRGEAAISIDQIEEDRYTINRTSEVDRLNISPQNALGIDPALTVVRVDSISETGFQPLAAYSVFAVHGTAVPPETTLWNGDLHAAGTRQLEWRVKQNLAAHPDFVHLFANANEGDIRANFNTNIRRMGTEETPLEHHFSEAHRIGERLADSVYNTFAALAPSAGATPILTAYLELDSSTAPELCGNRESTFGRDRPHFGVSMLAGSEEGPTDAANDDDLLGILFRIGEGERLAEAVGCQGHKRYPEVLGFEPLAFLVPPSSYPRWLSLQLIRIGNLLLVTVPGEATAEMGAIIKRDVLKEARKLDSTISSVALVGLANQFVSYFTTVEEYASQQYEGGSTIYGPGAGEYLKQELIGLTRAAILGGTSLDLGIEEREPPELADDELWPAYADESERRQMASKARHAGIVRMEPGSMFAHFQWRDTASPSTIELHRPLVKIQVRDGEGVFRDLEEDGVPQDDQGLDIEVSQMDRYDERWQAKWYGRPGQVRNGEYQFVIAGRSPYAEELISRPFRWTQ